MKQKICLVIIYNHNYEKNYESLQEIYATRFSQIFHLIPFTSRIEDNVIPVYGNSFFFGSYISQAAQILLKTSADFFFFAADDILLNPSINEDNVHYFFGVEENRAYLPYFTDLGTQQSFWLRSVDAINWEQKKRGLEVEKMLPTIDIWKERFADLNFSNTISIKSLIRIGSLGFRSADKNTHRIIWAGKKLILIFINLFLNFKLIFKWILRRGRPVRPLVGGYADVFIVPKKYFLGFSRLLGVLSSLELHVELAIPTSLAMQHGLQFSTNHELMAIGETQNPFKFWDTVNSRFAFTNQVLYLHPVKLSKTKD